MNPPFFCPFELRESLVCLLGALIKAIKWTFITRSAFFGKKISTLSKVVKSGGAGCRNFI